MYQHCGLEFHKDLEQAIIDYLKENPQGKHGKHRYTMEEYGLSKDDIQQEFKFYIDFLKTIFPEEVFV